MFSGEVSDSDGGFDSDSSSEFFDGYDENLMGDEDDRERLEKMTEKEREEEIFNRMEKREVLKTRYVDNIHSFELRCFRFIKES